MLSNILFTINRGGVGDLALFLEQTAKANGEHAANEIVHIPDDVEN